VVVAPSRTGRRSIPTVFRTRLTGRLRHLYSIILILAASVPPISTVGKSEKRRQAAHGPVNIQRSQGPCSSRAVNSFQAWRPLRATILRPAGTVLCERNDDEAGARGQPRWTNSYDITMLRSVKLTVDPVVAAWLGWLPATEWDAGNIVEPAHEEPRCLLLGVTKDGRGAASVFARRGEKLRPISCRAMRKKEKEAYDAGT
jgi:hypothetical protein